MKEEKDIFKVEQSSENFETWTTKPFVSDNIRQALKQTSILIVPNLGFRDINQPTFPVGTEDFLEYFRENLPKELTIDICIDDEHYYELALHSNYKRMGKFLVRSVALTVFLNLLSSYIYNKAFKEELDKPSIQIINVDNSSHSSTINQNEENKAPKKYMEPPKVMFSITVVDSNGTSKDFHYEGSVKDVKEVTEQIKQLWENGNK